MVNIFVLKLEQDKYYVGSCNNLDLDIKSYLNGSFGPKWIRKYKPIRVVEVISPCDIFDVDKHTKRYMGLYGINNVRGGAYTKVKLNKSDRNHIDKEIFTALGMCMHCGSENHVSAVCFHTSCKWQLKNFLLTLKVNLVIFKNNIKDCFNNYVNNNEQPRSKKYDTLILDPNEERALIQNHETNVFVDSPNRTYQESMEEDEDLFPSFHNSNHSLSFSSSYSPPISPPISPPGYLSHPLSLSPPPSPPHLALAQSIPDAPLLRSSLLLDSVPELTELNNHIDLPPFSRSNSMSPISPIIHSYPSVSPPPLELPKMTNSSELFLNKLSYH